jgi:hypothetical protein
MKYFIILFLMLLISVAFVFIRERTLEEYSPPNLKLSGVKEYKVTAGEDKKFNRSGVIILDIADLSEISFNDSAMVPELFKMVQSSRIYQSTVNLSPNRLTSLTSFFECLSPYKFNDGKEPHKEFKDIISDSIRNSSVMAEFRKAGYKTKLFTSDSTVHEKISAYFAESCILNAKEEVLEGLYKDIVSNRDTAFFYYADISEDYKENEHYVTDIDHQIGQLSKAIEDRLKIEPLIMLISTARSDKFSKAPAVFHQKKMKFTEEKQNVALTDIAKTLLNHSKIKPPNYFGGYDLDNDEEYAARDYFAGMCRDTLLLFNDEYIYKQKKYSEEYYYYDLKLKKDVTNSFIGINEKFHDLLPKYFGGDYAKYIILKNRNEKIRNFKVNISSNRRFEEFSALANYYKAEKKSDRYSKDLSIELEPGASDTITVYYSYLYQNFDFTFGEKFGLSYGAAGINAGTVKEFDENSYYGMKYFYTDTELFEDYDIRIYNIRINY